MRTALRIVGKRCETALVRIQDDILVSLDNRKTVILVLLDLSAAFDTVDHRLLLYQLYRCLLACAKI